MSVVESVPTERRAKRREQILAAGEICLVTHGYEGLKMHEVAKRADVAKGTLYLYFSSRDALCAAVAERKLAHLLHEFEALVASTTSGLAAIEAVITRWLSHMDERPHIGRVVTEWWRTSELDTSSDSFNEYRQRAQSMLAFFEDLLRRGKGDGSIHLDVDPRYDALTLWSAVFGSQLFSSNPIGTRIRLGDPFDPQALRAAHIRATLRSLSADPVS